MLARRYRHGIDTAPETKTSLRQRLLQARRALPPAERLRQNDSLAAALSAATAGLSTVAAYLPVGSEPGSVRMLDDLTARGVRVLLPIARNDADGTPLALRWADYRPGQLIEAPFGLREPGPPVHGPGELAEAQLVLVPAVAVGRDGTRLGRGAGFYDRSLAHAGGGVPLVAVVYEGEILDRIPADPHDVPVTHALTAHGLVTLGAATWRP